ncbi:TPA: hypothetical protein I8P16_003781 [Salmonella enterica subsp. enterica serovar Napoli]|uniref:Uncharacterized protein n=1 Tax=Salmonella enterica TaxID=28901 RepID=A0A743PE81_SALER|nr:hypothetical protein [Salmonella enterica subsp. enterica serovar Napoli]HAF2130679.1 hypothetical protein [Salmonella enterica]HBB6984086.1 hypothetical protein [Salmonella enterica subsp. enterica serovar Napoli]HBC0333600.1 hypothetical protein [Salmonella enterica subsp. enterica serovar Napoli]HBC0353284.1 hypothetical protein [Salmonella enterica subsp. enterica serovar Napoli]
MNASALADCPEKVYTSAVEQVFRFPKVTTSYSEEDHLRSIAECNSLLDEALYLAEDTHRVLSLLIENNENEARYFVNNSYNLDASADMFRFLRDHLEEQIENGGFSEPVNRALNEYLQKVYRTSRIASRLCMLSKQFAPLKYRDTEQKFTASQVADMKKNIEECHKELGLEPPKWNTASA